MIEFVHYLVKNNMIHYSISQFLIVVGALDLGVVGFTGLFGRYGYGDRFSVIGYVGDTLLGIPAVSDILYAIIGIAALIVLIIMMDRSGSV